MSPDRPNNRRGPKKRAKQWRQFGPFERRWTCRNPFERERDIRCARARQRARGQDGWLFTHRSGIGLSCAKMFAPTPPSPPDPLRHIRRALTRAKFDDAKLRETAAYERIFPDDRFHLFTALAER